MPRIRYRRADAHEPESIEIYGTTFEANKFVEVSDAVMAKARGNPVFEVQGEKSPSAEEAAARRGDSVEDEERRERARIAREGSEETKKAKQAEARGALHRDEKA